MLPRSYLKNDKLGLETKMETSPWILQTHNGP
jgi:hypothetical protein